MKNIDLISDDYTIIPWPTGNIHSCKFPYVVIRLAFGVFSIKDLPKDILDCGIHELLAVCMNATLVSKLQSCLVISKKECFYLKPDKNIVRDKRVPTGGTIVNWQKFLSGEIKSINLSEDKKLFYVKEKSGKTKIVFPNK